jgi:hypothetical protein
MSIPFILWTNFLFIKLDVFDGKINIIISLLIVYYYLFLSSKISNVIIRLYFVSIFK